MARDFDGTNDKLSITTPMVTAYPFTFSGWFNADNITNDGMIVAECDIATTGERWMLQTAGFSEPTDALRFMSTAGGTSVIAITSSGYSAGVWSHACGVGRSATSRDVYLNGGSKGSNATNSTPAGLDNTTIGVRTHTSDGVRMAGLIAEVAIWSTDLSDAEVAILADGYSALFVQPASLVAYWPIIGRTSPEIDIVGGNNMTVTEAVVADHPRIIYPAMPYIITAPAAALSAAQMATAVRMAGHSVGYVGRRSRIGF